jgi:hypothetical protein
MITILYKFYSTPTPSGPKKADNLVRLFCLTEHPGPRADN